jgi:capsular polysaccharide biosynthesis protein
MAAFWRILGTIGKQFRLRFSGQAGGAAHDAARQAIAAGDLARVRVICESILARDPSDREALEWLADISIFQGSADTAADLYARHARATGAPVIPALYRSRYMDRVRVAAKEPYVHVLKDVLLDTERGVLFDKGSVYVRETSGTALANHPYVNGRATPDQEFGVVSLPDPVMTIEQPFVLIGTDGGANFSHWLSRNILKLALIERGDVPPMLPLLVNEDLRDYQLDLLQMLGIGRERLLPVRRGIVVRCRQVFVPVVLRNHPRMLVGIQWLRERLARFIEPEERADELLFVSRSDSPHHVLLNEGRIQALLEPLGFKTVVLSGMPFAEQVRLFSRARVIVAAHGAGLTNLMFAPAKAVVVEIVSAALHKMQDFKIISQQMGRQHVEVVSDRYAAEQSADRAQFYHYYVDTDAVLEALKGVAGWLFAGRGS